MEDYPELLPPGFTDLDDAEDLEQELVAPFEPGSQLAHEAGAARRRFLISQFRKFLQHLELFELDMEVWIDGSFLTQKPKPNDVDLVIAFDAGQVDSLSDPSYESLFQIFASNRENKERYDCDAYMFLSDDDRAASYWSNWFGTSRAGTPKGMIRLRVRR